ncbi:MAG: TonB-dependent receptor [Melioribacter sp.]|nr:TonB-dependent receptor [Melioribacter sp.]
MKNYKDYFVNEFMNSLQKKYFRKEILLILLFFSNQLFAFDDFQVKNEKTSADSLINKITIPKDSTSAVKQTKGSSLLQISSLLDENFKTSIINKKSLESTDYRTTADFFINVPFGYVRDLGSVGQPNEVLIYGLGFGNVSFLSDGISINNRLSNALDLNLFQSESIDSIEVIPFARGFLYGGMNNPVSVNLISRQPELRKPYSRIKYYQAPNSEGMIDGIFNISPFKRLNAYFELTNQSISPIYTTSSATKIGTDHSNWMGAARLRYLLSNNINIIASYKYIQTNTQLFGGIDADSINRAYPASQFETILYDNFRAPVRYANRYQKVTGHNFSLRMLGNFIEHSPTDISFYYQTNLTEFRQNESSSIFQNNASIIFDDNEHRTIGTSLRQDINIDIIKLTSLTNFEKTKFLTPLLSQEINKSLFSTTAIASFSIINKALNPSLFARYLNYSQDNFFGFGADAIISLDQLFNFYVGFSSFEKPRTIWEERFVLPGIQSGRQKITSFELSANLKNSFVDASISYFNKSTTNSLLPVLLKEDPFHNDKIVYATVNDLKLQGLNLKLDLSIWKILLSANTSYYFPSNNRHNNNLPNFSLYGGVYYVDTLFNKNLHLKSGFNYFSIGERDFSSIDLEKNISTNFLYDPNSQNISLISPLPIPTSFQIDFFLAGKIQNSATIYFIFENLFNAKYFIVPYYPKQARGIRFGVAWNFLD